VTRHSAVVGATGTGKSTFVTGLLGRLTDRDRFPDARILVLDVHGEYAAALDGRADVFQVNPEPGTDVHPFHLPYWAMSFDELLAVSMGSLDDASRGAVLEKVVELKREALTRQPREGVTAESLTADTPVPSAFTVFGLSSMSSSMQRTKSSRPASRQRHVPTSSTTTTTRSSGAMPLKCGRRAINRRRQVTSS
jgi:DNA helicase HerA-like ATPase